MRLLLAREWDFRLKSTALTTCNLETFPSARRSTYFPTNPNRRDWIDRETLYRGCESVDFVTNKSFANVSIPFWEIVRSSNIANCCRWNWVFVCPAPCRRASRPKNGHHIRHSVCHLSICTRTLSMGTHAPHRWQWASPRHTTTSSFSFRASNHSLGMCVLDAGRYTFVVASLASFKNDFSKSISFSWLPVPFAACHARIHDADAIKGKNQDENSEYLKLPNRSRSRSRCRFQWSQLFWPTIISRSFSLCVFILFFVAYFRSKSFPRTRQTVRFPFTCSSFSFDFVVVFGFDVVHLNLN